MASTEVAADTETVQVEVAPEQAPLQRARTLLDAGLAVKVTEVLAREIRKSGSEHEVQNLNVKT